MDNRKGSGPPEGIKHGGVKKSLEQAYSDAVKFLDDNYAYFLTHVLNVGRPVLNPHFPTAAVFYNEKTQKTEFHIGEPMLWLTTEQFAFVISHETMHAHLNHIHFLKKFSEKAKSEKQKSYLHQKSNIAADCVINDWLWDRCFDVPEWVATGDGIVGHDCAKATVKEVFDEMVDPPGAPDGHDGEDEEGTIVITFGDGGGQGGQGGGMPCGVSEEMQKAIEKFLEDNPQYKLPGQGTPMDKQLGQKDAGGASQFPKDVEGMNSDNSSKVAQGVTAGFGESNEFAKWQEDTGTTMKWVELLKKINPDMFRYHGIGNKVPRDFHKKNRKLYAPAFGKTTLPVTAFKKTRRLGPTYEIPLIALALDTSGSISREDANRFITLAKSIPTKMVKLWVCTFTEVYRELDLENPSYPSGGTNFSAIENFVQFKMKETHKPYPKAVVVITDGAARFNQAEPPKDKRDNWTWLITGGYFEYFKQYVGENYGESYNLEEFVK